MKRYVVWDNDERVFVARKDGAIFSIGDSDGKIGFSDNLDEARVFNSLHDAYEISIKVGGDCAIMEVV